MLTQAAIRRFNSDGWQADELISLRTAQPS